MNKPNRCLSMPSNRSADKHSTRRGGGGSRGRSTGGGGSLLSAGSPSLSTHGERDSVSDLGEDPPVPFATAGTPIEITPSRVPLKPVWKGTIEQVRQIKPLLHSFTTNSIFTKMKFYSTAPNFSEFSMTKRTLCYKVRKKKKNY